MEVFMMLFDLFRNFVLFSDQASPYLICIHAGSIALSFITGVSETYRFKKSEMNLTRGLVALSVCGCLILNTAAINFLVSPALENPAFYHRFYFGFYYGINVLPCLWGMFYTIYLLGLLKSPEIYCICATVSLPIVLILAFVFPDMDSYARFGDLLGLAIQGTTGVWGLYAIFRLKKSKIYFNYPAMNAMMCVTFLLHYYGVSVRSADLMLIACMIPGHIVVYFFVLEYNFPGFTWREEDHQLRSFGLKPFSNEPSEEIVEEKVQRRNLMEGVNLQVIENRIEKFIKEREYTDEDLRLPDFAAYLGLTVHQTSFYLNQYKKLNFPEFINYHRMEEAKRMILDQAHLNLLEIALACGFNSPSSFHRASIKFTGISPRDLKKEIQRKALTEVAFELQEKTG